MIAPSTREVMRRRFERTLTETADLYAPAPDGRGGEEMAPQATGVACRAKALDREDAERQIGGGDFDADPRLFLFAKAEDVEADMEIGYEGRCYRIRSVVETRIRTKAYAVAVR